METPVEETAGSLAGLEMSLPSRAYILHRLPLSAALAGIFDPKQPFIGLFQLAI
jgi:hypothetical protein